MAKRELSSTLRNLKVKQDFLKLAPFAVFYRQSVVH